VMSSQYLAMVHINSTSTYVVGVGAEMHGEDTVLVDIAEDSLGCGVRV
jgi:hypothetical protein